ncbi:MAG: MoaD/ThiS family protein [Dehalococcoidia bacterium]|nr:MoaD/ThiS family protein [Dehalococcoidia bacterium]
MKPKPRVKVTLSPMLRHLSELTAEPEAFELEAATPLECLKSMVKRYPSLRKWVYDKEGKVLPVTWFFVNDPEMREKLAPDKLTNRLQDGDEVLIFFGKV